jgi:O-acetyl-ADP-ribose deacetylase (regulator of RNase III)
MEKESTIAKGLKKKEIIRARQSKRTVVPIHGDMLQQDVEVIVNSVGEDLKYGFGGAIGTAIVKQCGEKVIEEAIEEATSLYGSGHVKVGMFVSTSAGKSKKHKYILHCVCPEWDSKNCEKVLKDLIKEVFYFCDKVKVESIAVPPMSSGVLRFPTRN